MTYQKKRVNYYPFGLKHRGYNNNVTSTNPALKYRYNGKEVQDELDLDWIDYGARNYEASLGRWMNIDPLAEKYFEESAYNYALSNPVFFIDPDGKTVDVTDIVNGGTASDTWLLIRLVADLTDASGEELKITRNNVTGKSILTSAGCKEQCNSSEKASAFIEHLLGDNSGTITVLNNDRNENVVNGRPAKELGSQAYPDGRVYLDANQISSFQESLTNSELDERSMSTGLVFLHEALHTEFGASFFSSESDNRDKKRGVFPDPIGQSRGDVAGPTVNRINAFRDQMGYPKRVTYSNSNPRNPGSLVFEKDGKKIIVPIIYSGILKED